MKTQRQNMKSHSTRLEVSDHCCNLTVAMQDVTTKVFDVLPETRIPGYVDDTELRLANQKKQTKEVCQTRTSKLTKFVLNLSCQRKQQKVNKN